MINTPERILFQILNPSNAKIDYDLALSQAYQTYQLKPYNIMKLQPTKVLEIHKTISKKFYQVCGEESLCLWFENELRIFIWIVIVYAFQQNKSIEEMSEENWATMSAIFNKKNPLALEFQALCLARKQRSRSWAQEEIKLVINIMKYLHYYFRAMEEKNRWNEIAKSLYILSNKKYFRTPKQCREHWINHLDPTKIRSEWTTIEDYELIITILRTGKKWSKVAKELGNRRTEHMVKNRFRSMLNMEMKKVFHSCSEEMLILKIKQRLESSSSIKKYLLGMIEKQGNNKFKDDDSENKEDSFFDYCFENDRFEEKNFEKEAKTSRSEPLEKEGFEMEIKDFSTDVTFCSDEVEVKEENKKIENESNCWVLKSESDFEDIKIRDFILNEDSRLQFFNIDDLFE